MRYGTTWRRRYNRRKQKQIWRLRSRNADRNERASWYAWKWPLGWVCYQFLNETERAIGSTVFLLLFFLTCAFYVSMIVGWFYA